MSAPGAPVACSYLACDCAPPARPRAPAPRRSAVVLPCRIWGRVAATPPFFAGLHSGSGGGYRRCRRSLRLLCCPCQPLEPPLLPCPLRRTRDMRRLSLRRRARRASSSGLLAELASSPSGGGTCRAPPFFRAGHLAVPPRFSQRAVCARVLGCMRLLVDAAASLRVEILSCSCSARAARSQMGRPCAGVPTAHRSHGAVAPRRSRAACAGPVRVRIADRASHTRASASWCRCGCRLVVATRARAQ